MKIAADVNEVVLSNVGTTGEFKIRNSAKAFKILSDGLYKNKIRAIVRELGCNATDSHKEAGKIDIPFEVHLPTMLEPWFAVKDFGIGLSGDAVVNIYTTYFESTKTDSNDFIGALGLGSKSPFSYTENFTVTAIKDGFKRIYSAFINEMGVPSIAQMSEESTNEGNGVEVKFSVTDRYDYQTFRNEALHIFSWFKVKPVITGVSDFVHREIVYAEKDIVPGVHLVVNNNYNNHCLVVMGNISYPLYGMPEAQKHLAHLANLLDCPLILEFDIGELDFTASREELSYIPLTIASIKRKLELLNANLAIHLTKKANEIENEWERAEYLSVQSRTTMYRGAVAKYVTDTKFKLFDNNNKVPFTFQIPEIFKRGLTISGFRIQHGSSSTIRQGRDFINHNYVAVMQIAIDSNVVIVLNDLKTGCVERARYHYANHNGNKYAHVYCISHTSTDLAVRQMEYDAIIKELHNPPTVVKASELIKKPPVSKPLSTKGIMELGLKANCRPGSESSYTWFTHTDPLVDTETYYYTCLSNYESIQEDGNHFNINHIKSLMAECGVDSISNIKIFGVRKNRIKEIKELKNWVWIEEKIKEETAKVTDKHIASLVVAEMLDSYNGKVYTNTQVAKLVGPTSDYAKYVAEYGGIKRANGNVTQLVTLCSKYGKSVQVDIVKKKINDTKAALYAKYPLLRYLKDGSGISSHEVADYIKLVDNQ